MRRFERLMQKPVVVREIDVEGASVVTREGGGELVTTAFATPASAQAHADAVIAEWRADGFVPITRLAPVVETSVRRDTRREWETAKWGRYFREVLQNDKKTREISGRVVVGDDVDKRTETKEWTTIREASAVYDELVARMNREAVAAETEAAEYRERNAERAAAKKEAKRRKRIEQNRHPELEALCRAAHDAGPWMVYADWLIERDDPIGEAAILAMGGDVAQATAVLRRSTFELHPETEDERIDFELRYGFIRSVTLDAPDETTLAELVKRVLSSPACRFVDSIRLGRGDMTYTFVTPIAMLCTMPQAATLRELSLHAYRSVGFGDVAFAWPKLQALERLHVRGGANGNLGALELPNLRAFIRETGALPRATLASLHASPRPNLEHLELWTGSATYGREVELADLDRIFAADDLPRLRHLGIVNTDLSDQLIPALATSHILAQLDSLDLSKGIFANVATAHLVERAAAFRHLASFDLSENVLYPEEVAAIRDVLDNVITTNQREDDREDDFPDDPGERYVAVGE